MTRTTASPSTPRKNRTAEEVLRDAQRRGDAVTVGILTWLLDGREERQRNKRHARRVQLYGPERAELLAMDDRRRAAARRLPRLCDDAGTHGLGCFDPMARREAS